MEKIRNSPVSEYRAFYNDWVLKNARGEVLDVGKSTYWDYGFDTIDKNPKLCPTFLGDIEEAPFPNNSFDTVLCNGMYECVENPQRMVEEVMRILRPGGTAIFGFVGEGYKPYKKPWHYYKGFIEFIGFVEKKSFNNEYYFFICKK